MVVNHVGISVSGLSEAFQRKTKNYTFVEWSDYVNSGTTTELCELLRKTDADITFFHLQQPIPREIIESAGGYKVNWTWDIRRPIPEWYLDYASMFNVTIVPDTEDVSALQWSKFKKTVLEKKTNPTVSTDFRLRRSELYMPPHVDTDFYTNTSTDEVTPEVVFIGNNFGDRFANSQQRRDMVAFLREELGDRFGVYGHGWDNAITVSPKQERILYSNAKVVINHNHITAAGYTSDRMMRAMSCGAPVVSSPIPGGIPGLVDGHSYFQWHSFSDLINKINGLLEDEVLSSLVSANAARIMREEFSWDRFVEKVISFSEQNK